MNKIDKKRILLMSFFCILFLAILTPFYIQTKSVNLLVFLMFTPMISVILTRIITKEGFSNLHLAPRLKKNWKVYLFAWLGIISLAFVGSICFFLLFPKAFEPLSSGLAVQEGLTTIASYKSTLFTLLPVAIVMNPLCGLLQCFGEEFAWRGYLLPKLNTKFSRRTSAVLTSLMWGIWHAPIIAVGFNYGSVHPVAGILAQVTLCLVLGGIFAYLFFKTNSLWPVVLAHASINAIDKFTPQFLFGSKAFAFNPFIGPNLTSLIGGLGLIIAALICYKSFSTKKKELESALDVAEISHG